MSHRALFTVIVFLTVANLLVWGLIGVEKAYAGRVYPGVWIQAQPLAGLTREQVIDRLEPINQAMLMEQVTLSLNDKQYQPTLAQLGYRVDTAAMADAAINLGRGQTVTQAFLGVLDYQKNKSIPLVYDINQESFDSYLNEIGKDITKAPENMALDYRDGTIIVTPAAAGVVLNQEELKTAIQRQVKPGQPASISLSLTPTAPVIQHEPQIAEAKDRLVKLLSNPLKLQAEELALALTPDEIYRLLYFEIKDDKLAVEINQDAVQSAVSALAKKVDVKAIPKQVSAVNNSIIQEGQDGRQLNVPSATSLLTERITTNDTQSVIALKVDKIDRKVTTVSPEFVTGRFPGRYLEVDLSAQRMHLVEGDIYHKTAIISTGKWGTPTPIGEFQILNHIQTAWSKKYGLYMPMWMGLQKAAGAYEGYGIHGLPYWPSGKKEGESHLGRPVSHGCIRLGADDIVYLYEWAQNGTKVVIHE